MSDPELSLAETSAAPDATFDDAALPPPRTSGFRQLEDVIADESFPDVDLALRRGRHIHKRDERWYEFLLEAQGHLEAFYRRYGCELEQRSDGYFFLLPITDSLGKRHLGVAEMIVGQGLALCYLDPQSVQSGGLVTREELLNQLAAVMGTDALMRSLNPKRKRVDERVMQRTVRNKVNDALRRLAQLGFVELLDAERLQLAPSLMRFAEPVRGLDAPSEALKRLIEKGEISLAPGDADADGDGDADESEQDDADADEHDAGADEHDAEPVAADESRPAPAQQAAANPIAADDIFADHVSEGNDAEDPIERASALAEPAPDPDRVGADASEPAPSPDDDATEPASGPVELTATDAAVLPPELDFEWDSLSGEEPPGDEEA